MKNSSSIWAQRNFNPWVKPTVQISEARRNLPFHWDREAAASGQRERVYCGLITDPFDPAVPTAWKLELWSTIFNTANLDWVLVTNHVEAAAEFLASMPGPLANLCIGAYVSNQEEADARIPVLTSIAAAARSIHCEPLKGHLDLSGFDMCGANGIQAVICDVDSGPAASPFSMEWARELQAQCSLAEIEFYSRQLPALRDEPQEIES